MPKLSIADLQQLAFSTGFSDPSLAAAIAMAESGGDPNAVGDVSLGGSIGLWQIFTQAHPNYDPQALRDPVYNAKAAFAISSGGQNWQPWTTYRIGAYKPFVVPFRPSMKKGLAIAVGVGVAILAVGGVAAWAIYNDKVPMISASAAETQRKRKSMRIQSLLIPRSWGVEKAKAWAESHGYKHGKVDETENYIRLRQLPPGRFKTKRTIRLGDKGVKAVVAR